MSDTLPGLEWTVAQRPMPGETVSGDRCLVRPWGGGILLAAMDGLGHGEEAARAARAATGCLAGERPASDLAGAIRECHEVLRGTRGVALTAALYHPAQGRLQWVSVGNVEAVLWQRPGHPEGRRQCVTPRGGVVGYQLPTLHVATLDVAAGDVFCLATDGIASAFVEKTPAFLEPRRLAGYIMERYGKGTDDALVLAARFGEAEP
ncbi:MAG TPA: SpoIIE family protein phosphatase [Rhodocyclaceae bacterium]|nr:SpoIIE family protein phosphatase [Rhodocyclaceae bacterium]